MKRTTVFVRASRALATCLVAVAGFACSPGGRPEETTPGAVTLGRLATAPKYEPVVAIAVPKTFEGGIYSDSLPKRYNVWGSGALIAPNLVLTAGHVIALPPKTEHDCDFGRRLEPTQFRVFLGPSPDYDHDEGVGVIESFIPSDNHFCNGDIALMVLERPVSLPFFYSVNGNPDAYVDGRFLRVMGYGDSDAPGTYAFNTLDGTLHIGVRVINDDRSLVMRLRGGGAGDKEFITDEKKIGHADSGGCIVDRLTNVVMGVVSHGVPVVYTRVQSFITEDWWVKAVRFAQGALSDSHPKKHVNNYVRVAPLAPEISPKIEPGAFWDAERLTFPGFKRVYADCAEDLRRSGEGKLVPTSYVEPAVRTQSPVAGMGYVQRFEWITPSNKEPVWLMRGPPMGGVESDVVCLKPDVLTQAYLPTLPASEPEQAGQGCLGFPRWKGAVNGNTFSLKFATGRSITQTIPDGAFRNDCRRPNG